MKWNIPIRILCAAFFDWKFRRWEANHKPNRDAFLRKSKSWQKNPVLLWSQDSHLKVQNCGLPTLENLEKILNGFGKTSKVYDSL
jgi:hypothetical protein